MSEAAAIAIMARAPVAGEAKTRLIPALGAAGAAQLHAAMTTRMLGTALAAGLGAVELWCAPSCAHPYFAQCAAALPIGMREQPPGDLGARMRAPFECATGPLLLTGTDCPSITPEDIRACAAALHDGADAVFLPAEDGGYGLVGLARPAATLFAPMRWGTSQVMEETRARLRAAGLTWREPRVVWDIDTPADLVRLDASGLMPDWRSSRLPGAPA